MTEFGKKFEVDFKHSVPDGVFAYRIKTRQSTYKGDTEIADMFIYEKPLLMVLELKSTKEKRLPFDMIRPNQIIGLNEASKLGVVGGIVVQFREPYAHFFIPIHVLLDYISRGKKSIPIADMYSNQQIIEIPFTIKRVTCSLDVRYLIDTLKEEAHADST